MNIVRRTLQGFSFSWPNNILVLAWHATAMCVQDTIDWQSDNMHPDA